MAFTSTIRLRDPDADPTDTSSLQTAMGAGRGVALRPGCGRARVARIGGRSQVTSNRATNPLKLWVPRRPGPTSWIYATTFGGGLVAGDNIKVDLELEADTTTVLTTQASTKVYRSLRDRGCQQHLHASVGSHATLVVAPDPLVCFRGAIYHQHNRVHLAEDANLVHIDWLTSGRSARGECWQFGRLASRLEVIRDGRMLLLDSLELVPRETSLDNPLRMGRHHCLATVVLFGHQLTDGIESIRELAAVDSVDGCLESFSPKAEGLIWRLVGPSTEAVGRRLRSRLAFLANHLQETPWERKW